jgi:hypothetical protein
MPSDGVTTVALNTANDVEGLFDPPSGGGAAVGGDGVGIGDDGNEGEDDNDVDEGFLKKRMERDLSVIEDRSEVGSDVEAEGREAEAETARKGEEDGGGREDGGDEGDDDSGVTERQTETTDGNGQGQGQGREVAVVPL